MRKKSNKLFLAIVFVLIVPCAAFAVEPGFSVDLSSGWIKAPASLSKQFLPPMDDPVTWQGVFIREGSTTRFPYVTMEKISVGPIPQEDIDFINKSFLQPIQDREISLSEEFALLSSEYDAEIKQFVMQIQLKQSDATLLLTWRIAYLHDGYIQIQGYSLPDDAAGQEALETLCDSLRPVPGNEIRQ